MIRQKLLIRLGLLGLLSFMFILSPLIAQENTSESIYTKVTNSVILLKTADPVEFDGQLDLSTEYVGIQPVEFPAGGGKIAKVYIKQCSGVMYFGFHVPGSFFLKNFVRVAAGTSYESITALLYNPYNITRKSPLDKNLYIDEKNYVVPNKGFTARADAVHKGYWTCEIKVNLSELKIDAGLLGQQLYLSFAVADNDEKVYYSRDFQGWHSPATYFNVRSIDNWGQIDKESLITEAQITKEDEHYLGLYYIFEKADKLLKEGKYEDSIKLFKSIIEMDENYFFVGYTIADLYNKLSKYPEALEIINKTLQLNKYFLEAKVLKGAILEKLGRYEDALNHFRLLYAEYPDDLSFALQVGKLQVDMSRQAYKEAEKLEGEDKDAKIKIGEEHLRKSRQWFDALSVKYIDDIKVLVSIALIYHNANQDTLAKAYSQLAEGIVKKDVTKSPSLLNYYCFLRDKKSAETLTDTCIEKARLERDKKYNEVIELTKDQLDEIEKELEKIEKTEEKSAKRKELIDLKLVEVNTFNKHTAYLKYSAFVFEHASEYKQTNMFDLYAKYMKQLYELISDEKFPRRTMNGTVASEKIIAEYMIACVAIEDYELSAKIYDELKEIWRYKSSTVQSYITSYADIVNYPKYWEEEKKLREHDAKNNLPVVRIHTEKGQITLELFEDDAPNAVYNFIKNIELGLYKENNFSTVVKGLIVQGGDVMKTPGNIETQPNKRKFFAGTLAMVNNPDVKASENSKFFISLHAIPWLNDLRTVFGRVTEGMDVVYALEASDVIYSIDVLNKRKDVKYEPKYAE